jgi:hypothetical protein
MSGYCLGLRLRTRGSWRPGRRGMTINGQIGSPSRTWHSQRRASMKLMRCTLTRWALARAGVHPKLAQSLARHSDINLTMSRYTHTTRGEQHEALAALPDLPIPMASYRQATGTDGVAAESLRGGSVACYVARKGAGSVSSMHPDAPKAGDGKGSRERKKRRENPQFYEDLRRSLSVPRTGFEPVTPGLGNRCSIL